jgi:hypothetical protein
MKWMLSGDWHNAMQISQQPFGTRMRISTGLKLICLSTILADWALWLAPEIGRGE